MPRKMPRRHYGDAVRLHWFPLMKSGEYRAARRKNSRPSNLVEIGAAADRVEQMTVRLASPAARFVLTEIDMVRSALLLAGILPSLLYVAMNIVVAMQWTGYSSVRERLTQTQGVGAHDSHYQYRRPR